MSNAFAALGQAVGYVRVSTTDQNTDRQLEGIQLDRVFTDKLSGKNTDRPQLQACIDYVRQGDTLYVHSLDRFARNLIDLRTLVEQLVGKGVTVKFVKENMTFAPGKAIDLRDKLLFDLLGLFAEFERAMIRERQREGIALAKARGVYKGRGAALQPQQVAELRRRAAAGESKAALARAFRVDRTTVYRYLEE